MRYNKFQNGDTFIIIDSESKSYVAEVYTQDIAEKITIALNGTITPIEKSEVVYSKKLDKEVTAEDFTTHLSTEKTIDVESDEEPNEHMSQNDPNAPDFWKTGIKMKNGVEHYKCFYKCFNCNEQGKHYIPKDVRSIFCHKCNFELPVMTATPQGFPHRDEFGNYFVSKHIQAPDSSKLVKTWRTLN